MSKYETVKTKKYFDTKPKSTIIEKRATSTPVQNEYFQKVINPIKRGSVRKGDYATGLFNDGNESEIHYDGQKKPSKIHYDGQPMPLNDESEIHYDGQKKPSEIQYDGQRKPSELHYDAQKMPLNNLSQPMPKNFLNILSQLMPQMEPNILSQPMPQNGPNILSQSMPKNESNILNQYMPENWAEILSQLSLPYDSSNNGAINPKGIRYSGFDRRKKLQDATNSENTSIPNSILGPNSILRASSTRTPTYQFYNGNHLKNDPEREGDPFMGFTPDEYRQLLDHIIPGAASQYKDANAEQLHYLLSNMNDYPSVVNATKGFTLKRAVKKRGSVQKGDYATGLFNDGNGSEIHYDGQKKPSEIHYDGQRKPSSDESEIQYDGQRKPSEIHYDGQRKPSELHYDGQRMPLNNLSQPMPKNFLNILSQLMPQMGSNILTNRQITNPNTIQQASTLDDIIMRIINRQPPIPDTIQQEEQSAPRIRRYPPGTPDYNKKYYDDLDDAQRIQTENDAYKEIYRKQVAAAAEEQKNIDRNENAADWRYKNRPMSKRAKKEPICDCGEPISQCKCADHNHKSIKKGGLCKCGSGMSKSMCKCGGSMGKSMYKSMSNKMDADMAIIPQKVSTNRSIKSTNKYFK